MRGIPLCNQPASQAVQRHQRDVHNTHTQHSTTAAPGQESKLLAHLPDDSGVPGVSRPAGPGILVPMQPPASDGIPAFRPTALQCPLPSFAAPASDDSDSSPGKAQLQAVRALRLQHPAPASARHQKKPPQQPVAEQPPEGTPGYSESSSLGRAVNDHIASSIAELFMPTPPPDQCGDCDSLDSLDALPPGDTSPGCASDSTCCSSRGSWQARGIHRHAASPAGFQLPMPPASPRAVRTAMSMPGGLSQEMQVPHSILSPVFMSRKQRPLACDMDEPGRTIAFPHKRRSRTGRLQCFVASVFGCFVPPPGSRSPAPSLRVPSSRRASRFEGASPSQRRQPAGMEPLRQSLVGLAAHDADVRASVAASVVGDGGSTGPLASGPAAAPAPSALAALLAQQQQQLRREEEEEEEEDEGLRMNMASPVLPSQPCSSAASPAWPASVGGGSVAPGAGAPAVVVVAKRNLMDVLRSKEAGSVRSQHGLANQQQPQQSFQPRQGSRHAAVAMQQQQRPGTQAKARAKASHVVLGELLSLPTGGQGGLAGRHGAQAARNQSHGALAATQDGGGAPAAAALHRDLSQPAYRSDALHRQLSPLRAEQSSRGQSAVAGHSRQQAGEGGGMDVRSRRSLSAPASPTPHTAAVAVAATGRGGKQQAGSRGGSAPSSPLVVGPRLNRAATVRAAASQRMLADRRARDCAYMARSPDRWLQAAAAEGLSLRDAAVLASPGKTARPHYNSHHNRSPATARGRQLQQRQGAPGSCAGGAAAGLRVGTPGSSRFDSFETGVEPYSARLLTAEKRRRVGAASSGLRPLASAGAAAEAEAPPPLQALKPGGLDFSKVASNTDAYLQMLHALASGLECEPAAAEPAKQTTGLPLTHLPAVAALRRQEEGEEEEQGRPSVDGADTVRARLTARQEWPDTSRTAATAVYSLHAASSNPSPDLAARTVSVENRAPTTPHHNALFGGDATPTKSSPLAEQRMVSMSAAAAAQAVEQWQAAERRASCDGNSCSDSSSGSSSSGEQAQRPSAGNSSGSAHSISFGSGGCWEPAHGTAHARSGTASEQHQQRKQRQSSPARGGQGSRGSNPRLAALADLLEGEQQKGRHCGMRELQQAGFSSHDLQALKAWLARQEC